MLKNGIYELRSLDFTIMKKNKNMSKGEKLVSAILGDLGISFEQEKKFADLKSKSYLRFDFYFEINERGFCIEFDGDQHREPVEFFGGEEAFNDLKKRDSIKEEYCERKNITLIRVDKLNKDKATYDITKGIIKGLTCTKKSHRPEVFGRAQSVACVSRGDQLNRETVACEMVA